MEQMGTDLFNVNIYWIRQILFNNTTEHKKKHSHTAQTYNTPENPRLPGPGRC